MKKTIKLLVIFLISILGLTNSLAINIKTLNNEINSDIIQDKNNILLLKTEIINEKFENDEFIRNYQNVLIKYSNTKEIFKIKLSPKTIKSNKKGIYNMPDSLIYNDNNYYYILENTSNNLFSLIKLSKDGKIKYNKSFSGYIKNIKSINDNELILIGGDPAFIIKINKDTGEELAKVIEDKPSIFNDFIINKSYFLMVGEDRLSKESLLIKYDFSLNKIFSMSLGYKEFKQIIKSKNNNYFLLGENNLGGILTNYSDKERILFQKDKEKNVNAEVLKIDEDKENLIIFTYLKDTKQIEITKYKNQKLVSKKHLSSNIKPYILKDNTEFYITTNDKLYKINKKLKTSYQKIKNINKIIKIITSQSSLTIISDKSIDNYNKIFIVENFINYIFIILIILIIIGTIYFIKISNIKFNEKPKNTKKKLHTKLHNQSKEKVKNKNKKKHIKKHKKNKKK